MKKIALIIAMFFIAGCYEPLPEKRESKLCPPGNYEILFNGEQYAVRIWGIYIFHHEYFDTVEDAIEYCITHDEQLREHELFYYDEWEIVETCI